MSSKTILLCEDGSDDVALAIRAFKKNHITNEIVVARDGVEALDYLYGAGAHAGRDVRQQPQIVLLDLKLPKINGLEVLRRMRAEPCTKHIPVIILTSSGEDCDLAEGYDLGANSYIRKPLDFAHFVEAIRQVHLYWMVMNEAPPAPNRR